MWRCNPASVTKGSERVLCGEFWFDFGDTSFPDENWLDFVSPVFGWWCAEFDRLKDTGKAEFEFMDSPCAISAVSQKQDVSLVGFWSGERRASCQMPVSDFQAGFVKILIAFEDACRDANFQQDAEWLQDLRVRYFGK
ncbi:hypothetical protein [Aquisalinus flavus]|uniref:Uncharacterized protein n=1 Tax=Aquisalinus flavus TaxID=1526572 RepID=A0A8J2V372_9PROT|nr:hypothetical protein [Aquisalinus flavus]MBD0425942.1 hypothetical protein [Aquisalinus flavus]UNE48465.1 hypothetical protein FF099_10600 [Aquisalinus flavus]GGD11998.1 hypothetical protein GCM10011342_21020 [Aquisalinus flavus]